MNISYLKNKNIHFVECENWYDACGYEKSEMKEDTIKYIEQLQQENQSLKEKVLLLQASEPMLEFAKQTYETYWETLKQLLIDKFNVTQDTIYLDILTDLMKPIEEKEVK